ncbi:MAG: hypothetical protein OIF32_00695 [Campylobacterales bacterium]|nr:hypothetical protein [Campylobacterales bacterium]
MRNVTPKDLVNGQKSFKAFRSLDLKKKSTILKSYVSRLDNQNLKKFSALLEILVLKDKNKGM